MGRKRPGIYSFGTINNPKTTTINLIGRKTFGSRRTYFSQRFIRCQNDSDSDGILNGEDECRYEYTNSSINHGCPGYPALIVDEKSTLAAPAWGHYELGYARSSNNPPILSRFDDGFFDFTKLRIKNIGDGNAVGNELIKINFYISKDNKISSDDFKFPEEYIINSYALIEPDRSKDFRIKLFGESVANNLSYGRYIFIINLQHYSKNGNTKESTYSFPVEYINTYVGWTWGNKQLSTKEKELETFKNPSNNYKPYSLNVYSFDGKLVKSTIVSSEIEEKNSLINLKSGVYILKTPNKIQKIIK
ncbi:T9SS type A sorting domain-containing protein [Seonamhaeicola marinus]|uniref:T9SS type A sorting domain-containing protein n=1 Tax=Seonamhaeicola marinus TaxID=1912246 RepID=UPI00165251BF|nr:T9SS type A sorting domain-containing protein [Seonamhaeicola marinus]